MSERSARECERWTWRGEARRGHTEAEEARQEQRWSVVSTAASRAPGNVQANSNAKPMVSWLSLPMAGWKGDAAAASQTSARGLDMVQWIESAWSYREAAQVASVRRPLASRWPPDRRAVGGR